MVTDDHAWAAEAVRLASENVTAGGGPFAALIVKSDAVLATGTNRVTLDLDPTAHAEVSAIRRACREVGDFALRGCVLYSSCEPCPMCLASALWARLDRVVYVADRDDAARGGFDDRAFYELLARDRGTWRSPSVTRIALPEGAVPFDAWLAKADRTSY